MNYCMAGPLLAGFRVVSEGKVLIRLCLSVALVPSVNCYEVTHRKEFAYILSRYQKRVNRGMHVPVHKHLRVGLMSYSHSFNSAWKALGTE